MEVVNIPQQREYILNILDNPSSSCLRIEAVVMNTKQQQISIPTRPRGKVPLFSYH
jgi:hypothetical protein